jgi:hypothetical protein
VKNKNEIVTSRQRDGLPDLVSQCSAWLIRIRGREDFRAFRHGGSRCAHELALPRA